MKYHFSYEDMKEVVRKKVNSPDKLQSRNGEYVLPFVSELPPGDRIHELYGHLLQEKDRLKNLIWRPKDLQRCLDCWKSFYAHNCKGSSRTKGRYTDDGEFSLETLWKGFLDYSGQKRYYRMRLEKTNREVLEKQLKIVVDWKEGEGPFPVNKIEKKKESIEKAIEQTKKDILETETRLNIALALLQKEYQAAGVPGEEYRSSSAYREQLRNIYQRVEDELQNGRKNPQEES